MQVKISTLELLLAEAETAKQRQLDQKEQAILELQRASEISECHLQSQLHQKQQAVLDLQRQASDIQSQASETEHNLRSQIKEEKRRHSDEIETVRDELRQLLSSREVEVWNVPRGDVKIDKEIGVGGWGSISSGTFHGQAVAIKQLHPDIISSDNISRLRREVRLMANVRHPNILLFIAAVFDEAVDQLHPPLIVLELLDVDLRKAYKVNMVGPSNHISIFRDVACALNYLHCLREPIIHRDLSAPNVLLEAMANNHWKAKVSDFGSANLAKHAQTAAEGAIIYSAPESLPKEVHGPHPPNFPMTPKIDIYSYGVLLCEVITRTLPNQLEPLKQKLKSMWPFMHSLVNMCTEYDPNKRPTISRILTELNQPGRTCPVEDDNLPHQTQSPLGSDPAGGPSSGQPQYQQRAGQPPPQQRDDSSQQSRFQVSMSHGSGDAETQIPQHRTQDQQDQEAQKDIRYPYIAGEPRPLTDYTHFQCFTLRQLPSAWHSLVLACLSAGQVSGPVNPPLLLLSQAPINHTHQQPMTLSCRPMPLH